MSVEKTVFGRLPDGREVPVYTLKNAGGMTLVTTPYGCRIVQLWVPDRNGVLGDVVLGHRTLEEYFGSNFQGAFVGRYANRIGGAAFRAASPHTGRPERPARRGSSAGARAA